MTDSISVRCPACRARLTLKGGNLQVRKVSCPKCGKLFNIPASPVDQEDDELLADLEAADASVDESSARPAPIQRSAGQRLPGRKAKLRTRAQRAVWLVPGLIAGCVVGVAGIVVVIGLSSGWFGKHPAGDGREPETAQTDAPASPMPVRDASESPPTPGRDSAEDPSDATPATPAEPSFPFGLEADGAAVKFPVDYNPPTNTKFLPFDETVVDARDQTGHKYAYRYRRFKKAVVAKNLLLGDQRETVIQRGGNRMTSSEFRDIGGCPGLVYTIDCDESLEGPLRQCVTAVYVEPALHVLSVTGPLSAFDQKKSDRFLASLEFRKPSSVPASELSSPVVTNSVGMELVLIQPGEFKMGVAGTGQVDVTLTKAFYLGKTEVTQAQWRDVMGTTPWKKQDLPQFLREGDRYPATNMSCEDAVAFCNKLGEREKVVYRLPSEAEWEYACRAGTTTRYSFGDDESQLGHYAWYMDNTLKAGQAHAHEVGRKKPNPFGLFDMYGNVWEWCADASKGDSSKPRFPGGVDPLVTNGTDRVLRGGGWDLNGKSFDNPRWGQIGGVGAYNFGLRVCRSADKPDVK